MREFVGRELAHQHRASVVQLRHGRRVETGDRVDAGARMPGRADTGGSVDVLEPERDAVHRSAIVAGGDFALGGARLVERAIRCRQQIRV